MPKKAIKKAAEAIHENGNKTVRTVVRVAGKLREIVTVTDHTGKVVQKFMKPLMLEFYLRDVIQIIVGAAILTVPVAFTEEVWTLGETLPLNNVIALAALSLLFIGLFVYYNYYRVDFKHHRIGFFKRVLSTYLISILFVALFLTIIDRAPWGTDFILAFKRMVLIAFPASMSAAVVDIIK